MSTKFDLKSFRENVLHLTLEQFAATIGLDANAVLSLEKDSSQISLDTLALIADKFGITLDKLVHYERPKLKPIRVQDTWKSANFTKKALVDYIEQGHNQLLESKDKWHIEYVDELQNRVNKFIRKPKVAFVGRSDVGKSALINFLLGVHKMPTSWTPTTSIPVYIKHIKDRPSYMKEDVWVFKRGKNAKNGEWDDRRLDDEKYCRQWKLSSGNTQILDEYGTRQGTHYEDNSAGAAVIFVDSPILIDCDFIDLPGYGTGDRAEDDSMTLDAKNKADILVYLSLANGFMRQEDIIYLKEAIKNLSTVESKENPLSNLFIVASQAHTVDCGNMESLTNILDNGCMRFEKGLTKNFWKQKEKITGITFNHDILRRRFFTFTMDIERVRSEFIDNLRTVIEKLPAEVNSKAKELVKSYAKSVNIDLDKEIASFEKILKDKEKYEVTLDKILSNEPMRANDTQSRRLAIADDIVNYRQESINDFSDRYGSIMTIDNIIKIIKDKEYENKKDDYQALSNYLSSLIEDDLHDVLQKNSKKLSKKIDSFISAFESDCNLDDVAKVQFDSSDIFNAKKAFASGLAGLATFGGLAVWASTLGNLGAYILVAKGVSLLSAIGISVGGVGAAAAAISAIGGPIVLGIALASITAAAVWKLLFGNWKKDLAKKIVAAADKQKALNKYVNYIDVFWDDTQTAFDKAADNMENEWKEKINNLKGLIDNYDVEDIQDRISKARNLKDFFVNIPLLDTFDKK